MRDAGRVASVVGVDGYDFFAYFTPGLTVASSLVVAAFSNQGIGWSFSAIPTPGDSWFKGGVVVIGMIGFFMISYALGHLTASIGNLFDDWLGKSTKAMLFGKERRDHHGCTIWLKPRPYNKEFLARLRTLYHQRFAMDLNAHMSEQGLHIWMMHNYNQAYCKNREWYNRFVYKMVVLYGFCSNMGTSLLIASLIIWPAMPLQMWTHMIPLICAAIWYLLFYRSRHLYYNYYVSTITTTFVTSCEATTTPAAKTNHKPYRCTKRSPSCQITQW